jgi:hypothetical protein
MMRETELVPDDEDDEARRQQILLERPQRSHEESTNKYKDPDRHQNDPYPQH